MEAAIGKSRTSFINEIVLIYGSSHWSIPLPDGGSLVRSKIEYIAESWCCANNCKISIISPPSSPSSWWHLHFYYIIIHIICIICIIICKLSCLSFSLPGAVPNYFLSDCLAVSERNGSQITLISCVPTPFETVYAENL